MQIAVTFRHIEADDGVKEYVREKVAKLEKYLENPREVHVVLSVEKFRQLADLTILGNGITLNSQGKENDLYAAIDQMVEKMERQIRERREKGRRKRTSPSTSNLPPVGAEKGNEEGDVQPDSLVIQRKQLLAKPMSPEEALAQLSLSKEDILFFVNSNSGQMNALYRGKEGSLEWVEPQAE